MHATNTSEVPRMEVGVLFEMEDVAGNAVRHSAMTAEIDSASGRAAARLIALTKSIDAMWFPPYQDPDPRIPTPISHAVYGGENTLNKTFRVCVYCIAGPGVYMVHTVQNGCV